MSSNRCEIRVGRLMEIRVAGGYRCVQDVEQMIEMISAQAKRLPAKQKYLIAADWRGVSVMSPETSTRAREMLAQSNERVLRSSILTLSDQSTTNLQVQRLVREAENVNRRHFTVAREQHAWLSEILTAAESARLSEFLTLPPSVTAA